MKSIFRMKLATNDSLLNSVHDKWENYSYLDSFSKFLLYKYFVRAEDQINVSWGCCLAVLLNRFLCFFISVLVVFYSTFSNYQNGLSNEPHAHHVAQLTRCLVKGPLGKWSKEKWFEGFLRKFWKRDERMSPMMVKCCRGTFRLLRMTKYACGGNRKQLSWNTEEALLSACDFSP